MSYFRLHPLFNSFSAFILDSFSPQSFIDFCLSASFKSPDGVMVGKEEDKFALGCKEFANEIKEFCDLWRSIKRVPVFLLLTVLA